MRYSVLHETEYLYDSVVTLSQQMTHLTPRNSSMQFCEKHALNIDPIPAERVQAMDYFGNFSDYFAIFSPHKSLKVVSKFSVFLKERPTLAALHASSAWESVKHSLNFDHGRHQEAVTYLFSSPKVKCSERLADYAGVSFSQGRPIIEAAFHLTQRIFNEFEFDPEATDVSTPLDQVLKNRRGVCQDFAHLMIGCLRSLGLACRYVSGYILTIPANGAERLIGADASHAWVSVYCPINGWIDFDPTNNCLVQQEHITVAWGRDFSDVSPMHGVVLGGGKQHLKVRVTVTPLAI
jgi:transglutaminase-like putative cysteine protease